MDSLALVLSSAAKFKVVGLLCERSSPLPLRHVSYLTGLPVRSVELAVASLYKQEVVRRRRSSRQVQFSINDQHPLTPLLREIFALVREHENAQRTNLDAKARSVLSFVDSANDLFLKVKSR